MFPTKSKSVQILARFWTWVDQRALQHAWGDRGLPACTPFFRGATNSGGSKETLPSPPRPKMATDPSRTPGNREQLPLPNSPCAGDDGKQEEGGASKGGRAQRSVLLRSPSPAPRSCVPARSPRPTGRSALPAGILGPPSQSSRLALRRRDPRFSQDGGAGFGVTAGDDRA